MSVLRPRNRLVYFRISEDEFEQFAQICETARARSISDLARVAVLRMITDGEKTQPSDVYEKLKVLEAGISDLNRRVQELATFVMDVDSRGTGQLRRAAPTQGTRTEGKLRGNAL